MEGKETPSPNENRRMLKEQIAGGQAGVSLLREIYAGEDLNLTMDKEKSALLTLCDV